ncbi:hypothetical protein QBC37DRAFT_387897 [Rhypophila decipiens]|uniref:Uncharacterized protein n=1 Tax=Rhypophila decipiens TaxID=261697 RepID=A0AAN6Y6F2_9PEZI|nr:hypothetical protein QBC37DRAFT_387897 [Rhypophila decipiens]
MWVPSSRNYKAAYGFNAELRACIDSAKVAKEGQAPWDPDRGNWPLNDWCWGTLIALADVKMDQYQKGILNWDHLDSVIEPHHPRKPSAAPLNMKAEAKKYIGELMLEETMPAPWTGEPVPVPIGLSRRRRELLPVWEQDKKGNLVPGPGITRTFPTGHRDAKYMTYDGLAREGEPGGERRFNHWVPTFQDHDPDVSGYMDKFSPTGSETDRPPGDEKDPYWEEVDYTIEPSHDETDLGPFAQERTNLTTTGGLIVDPSRSLPTVATWIPFPWKRLQVGDDEDAGVTEVLQTGLTTPGGTPFSPKAWNQLTTEILRREGHRCLGAEVDPGSDSSREDTA